MQYEPNTQLVVKTADDRRVTIDIWNTDFYEDDLENELPEWLEPVTCTASQSPREGSHIAKCLSNRPASQPVAKVSHDIDCEDILGDDDY